MRPGAIKQRDVAPGGDCERVLLPDGIEDRARIQPQSADRDAKQQHDQEAALRPAAALLELACAEGLRDHRRQRVRGRGRSVRKTVRGSGPRGSIISGMRGIP